MTATAPILSLSWSTDGKYLATCAQRKDAVSIWNAVTGKFTKPLETIVWQANCVAFSPASATPGDNSAASILTIQMPAMAVKSSFLAPVSLPRNPLGPLPLISFGIALSLFAMSRRMKFALRGRQVAVWAMTFALVALTLAGVSGCRGGLITSTPQSFAIVVTGTSGVQSHSTTVMLNIR